MDAKVKSKRKKGEKARPWPADKVERWPLSKLVPSARNARTHTAEQIRQIAASIEQWGFTTSVLIDETGNVIAGHGRIMAAELLGLPDVPVAMAVGWTDEMKRAYAIADNQLALNAGWDEKLLGVEIKDLESFGFDMGLIGFTEDQLENLLAGRGLGDEALVERDHEGKGGDLSLVNVSIAEPTHKVERGDHYVIGGRHHLLCVGPMTQWAEFMPLLVPGAILCTYPGPFVPYGKKADDHPLVLVQPDPYTAGHILDRYAELRGEKQIVKVGA